MSVTFLPLPSYNPGPQGYNFQPVAQGLETVRKQQNQNQMMEAQQEQQAQQASQFDRRMSLDESQFGQRMDMNRSQFSQTHGLQKNRLQMMQEAANRARSTEAAQKFAGLSQYVLQAPEDQRAGLWQRIVSANPRIAETMQKYGVDPADYQNGAGFLISISQGVGGPTYGKTGAVFELNGQMHTVQFADDGSRKIVPLDQGMVPANQSPALAANKTRAIDDAKSTAAARSKLPMIERESAKVESYIDGVLNHPSFEASTGVFAGYRPSISGSARDFDGRLQQLRGKAFVTAFEKIKGGGAITETEGAAAAQALARLQQADIGSENFRAALQDFRQELQGLVQLARQKAGVSQPQASQQPSANDPLGIR